MKVLMVDPSPAGWAYGFPKALPQEAVEGEEVLSVKPDFDLSRWIVEQGYPEESLGIIRFYESKIQEMTL